MTETLLVRDTQRQVVSQSPTTETLLVRDTQRQVVFQTSSGPQGAPGIGIELKGVYAALADLQAAHPTGAIGDAYAVGGDLYVWDEDTGAWINAGAFRGPAGADGTPGQIRFTGQGAPGTIIGAQPNDTYLDTLTGTIYTLL